MDGDMLIEIVPFFFIGMLLIFFFVIFATEIGLGEVYEKETKCYDKFGNEIKDLVCKECYQYNLFGKEIILQRCGK